MTTERIDQTVVTERPMPGSAPEPAPTATDDGQAPSVASSQTVRTGYQRTTISPGSPEMFRRIIVYVFGLIQLVIGLRIVLLLLDARGGNALVSGILDVSQVFVGPFEGILNTNALTAGGSTLDIAAVVALVGWTIVELIVIRAVGIFRPEPA